MGGIHFIHTTTRQDGVLAYFYFYYCLLLHLLLLIECMIFSCALFVDSMYTYNVQYLISHFTVSLNGEELLLALSMD